MEQSEVNEVISGISFWCSESTTVVGWSGDYFTSLNQKIFVKTYITGSKLYEMWDSVKLLWKLKVCGQNISSKVNP